jgi:DNA-binding transcriptional LysR family regulator
LRILKAIAAEGSFKKAAESLYISQPAVSLQVQNLEKQLSVPIFDRGNRKAAFTEEGEVLLRYGSRILSLCDESCRAIEDLRCLNAGTLVIGASQTTGTYLMPRLIGLFRQKYPQIAVQLQVHSTRRISWSVANGQVNLAIIGGRVPPELDNVLQITPYAEDELALILPKLHPFSKLEYIQKEDLYQVLNQNGIDSTRFKIEMELNSVEAIKNAVQSGLGAAFVSISAIAKELELGILHWVKIEDITIKRTLSIVVNPNRYRSKASQAFSKEILTLFVSPYKDKY